MILSPSMRAYATCTQHTGFSTFNPVSFLFYLGDDVSVGETNDDTVLGGVVFVLVLNDKTLAGIVVCLPFPPTLEFHLVAFEVRPVLHDLHERLGKRKSGT